jgi:hypothetical protein
VAGVFVGEREFLCIENGTKEGDELAGSDVRTQTLVELRAITEGVASDDVLRPEMIQ